MAADEREVIVRWKASSPVRVQVWFEGPEGLIDTVQATARGAGRGGAEVIAGLEPGTPYTVRLVAWNDAGAPWFGPPTQVVTRAASWTSASGLSIDAVLEPAACRIRPAALTARDWLRAVGAPAVGLGIGALVLGSWWRKRGAARQAVSPIGPRPSESPTD